VRQEHIKAILARGSVFGEDLPAEFANAGAEIAQDIFLAAGDQLDATGVAAEGSAHREGKFAVDEGIDRLRSFERTAARSEKGAADFRAHPIVTQRGRERAAAAPEVNANRLHRCLR